MTSNNPVSPQCHEVHQFSRCPILVINNVRESLSELGLFIRGEETLRAISDLSKLLNKWYQTAWDMHYNPTNVD